MIKPKTLDSANPELNNNNDWFHNTEQERKKKLIQNGKKRFWKMESHMVASQPGSGSCSKRNLWGTQFSFTSVKQKKKTGNERGKKQNKEKHAKGNCQ